jgi:hypothetical protein
VERFLEQIREELVSNTYRPMRTRKKEIPKDGGKRVRVLSIPGYSYRVVQGALKLILGATQFPACRFLTYPAVESLAKDVKFGLRHSVLQPENQAIVKEGRVIQAVAIREQDIGDGTHVEHPILARPHYNWPGRATRG